MPISRILFFLKSKKKKKRNMLGWGGSATPAFLKKKLKKNVMGAF
jgi:hypothetical protein